MEETVTVTQAAGPLNVSPNSKSVGFTSGTTTFTVSSTIGWSVGDDAAWLTATKINASTISVSYQANASPSSRTANIKAFGTGAEETVTVTQAAAPLDVSPNSKSVGFNSGTTTFTVSSTIGWSVGDDAAWLTATKIDGSTISVSYQMNLSQSSRTANIKAFGTGVEETVTVTQSCVIVFICGS